MFMRRLLIALALSFVGSAMFTFWLSTRMKKQPDVKLHYVASLLNADAGQVLTKESLKTVDWPGTAPLIGAFTKPEELVGRTLLYPATAGDPITDRQLAAVGSGAGLSPHIPDGMRAISLKSDAVTGVAGYLLPGTHVDVLVTYKAVDAAGGSTGAMITSTVLQDVPILTAGQQLQPDPTGKAVTTDVVTLLVTPVDAQKATLASSQGTIHFILRNGADHQHLDDTPIQLVALGGKDGAFSSGQQQPARAPAANAPGSSHALTLFGGGAGNGLAAGAGAGTEPANPRQGSRSANGQAVRQAAPAPKGYQVQTILGSKSSVESF